MEKRPKLAKLASSTLFTLRIWCERVGEDQKEWRGQVEHVMSGNVIYFRDWAALIAFLEETGVELELLNADQDIA